MTMHHGLHVRTHLVNLAMDESLAIDRTAARVNGIAVEVEGDEVAYCRIAGRDRLYLQVLVRIARIANADVTEGVEHPVMGEDVIGRDKIYGNSRIEIGVVGAEVLCSVDGF